MSLFFYALIFVTSLKKYLSMIDSLIAIFERDLNKLIKQLEMYSSESALWKVDGTISNSGGTLALHICGNLQHFIGATLGNSGYIRQRDLEFSRRDVSLSEMLEEINTTSNIVKQTLENLDHNKLSENYPINVFGKEMTTEFFLLHLTTHLSYHLGQVNYHRRLLDI